MKAAFKAAFKRSTYKRERVEIMKSSRIASLLISLTLILIILSGCSSGNSGNTYTTSQSKKITDTKEVYAQDNDEMKDVYVTIVKENTVTMKQVDAWQFNSGTTKPEIYVRLDYDKPAEDVDGVKANAVLGQRGHWASTSYLKSYKIKLDKSAEKWEGQDVLNLNKHPDDITRLRNKLCFDLIKMFPDTFSCRTQFCHLYVRDLNSSDVSYADYGLFTHVEDIGKNYFKSRNINKNPYLYKAKNFDFLMHPDVIKNVKDPGYNKAEFEKMLEIEGPEDHTRLIEMLKAVNDENQDINDVIDKYFDRDNYVTWLALNLLLTNTDTHVANFYLMSPADQNKWYFMTWDYDLSTNFNYELAFESDQYTISYMTCGVSMYWGVPLHRRFLQDPNNVKELTAKIEELSKIATDKVVADKVDKYYSLTSGLVKSNPDKLMMNAPVSVYESEVQNLKKAVDYGKTTYYEGLKMPMPFTLNEVKAEGGSYKFSWGKSYDFDGDSLKYDLFISRTPYFEDVVQQKLNLKDTSAVIKSLKPGTYYWKVEAVDPAGNRQGGLGLYYDQAEDLDFFSIRKLVVN